jgi:hypothetical protein
MAIRKVFLAMAISLACIGYGRGSENLGLGAILREDRSSWLLAASSDNGLLRTKIASKVDSVQRLSPGTLDDPKGVSGFSLRWRVNSARVTLLGAKLAGLHDSSRPDRSFATFSFNFMLWPPRPFATKILKHATCEYYAFHIGDSDVSLGGDGVLNHSYFVGCWSGMFEEAPHKSRPFFYYDFAPQWRSTDARPRYRLFLLCDERLALVFPLTKPAMNSTGRVCWR